METVDGSVYQQEIVKTLNTINEMQNVSLVVIVGLLTGFIFALGFFWHWGRDN